VPLGARLLCPAPPALLICRLAHGMISAARLATSSTFVQCTNRPPLITRAQPGPWLCQAHVEGAMKPKPTVPAVPRSNRTQAPHPPSQGRPPIKDVNVRVFDAHPRRVTVQVVLDLDPRLVRLIADDLASSSTS
jgi:hypothetical protein